MTETAGPTQDQAKEAKPARVIIEVLAGIIPNQPEPEFTRRYAITSEEWNAAQGENQAMLLAERNGQAFGYANLLALQPDHVNWVRVDWIWL